MNIADDLLCMEEMKEMNDTNNTTQDMDDVFDIILYNYSYDNYIDNENVLCELCDKNNLIFIKMIAFYFSMEHGHALHIQVKINNILGKSIYYYTKKERFKIRVDLFGYFEFYDDKWY